MRLFFAYALGYSNGLPARSGNAAVLPDTNIKTYDLGLEGIFFQ